MPVGGGFVVVVWGVCAAPDTSVHSAHLASVRARAGNLHLSAPFLEKLTLKCSLLSTDWHLNDHFQQ